MGKSIIRKYRILLLILGVCIVIAAGFFLIFNTISNETESDTNSLITNGKHVEKDGFFTVVDVPTPNISDAKNSVEGIILHHTAVESGEKALDILTRPGSGVSAHVLIDTDGTRYILASPEAVTWHAGKSRLNGREGCNDFTVGIEFQGNTVETPLTDKQIESAIDYILPIIRKYNIPMQNIATHQEIRTQYKKAHPKSKVPPKVDLTPDEYDRFMKALRQRRIQQLFPGIHGTQFSPRHPDPMHGA